jgi:hypothetical protein
MVLRLAEAHARRGEWLPEAWFTEAHAGNQVYAESHPGRCLKIRLGINDAGGKDEKTRPGDRAGLR